MQRSPGSLGAAPLCTVAIFALQIHTIILANILSTLMWLFASFQTEHVYIVHQPWPQARAPGPDVRHLQGAELRSGDAALLRRGVLWVLCQDRDNLLWELSAVSGIIRHVFYSELSQLYQVSSMTDIIHYWSPTGCYGTG